MVIVRSEAQIFEMSRVLYFEGGVGYRNGLIGRRFTPLSLLESISMIVLVDSVSLPEFIYLHYSKLDSKGIWSERSTHNFIPTPSYSRTKFHEKKIYEKKIEHLGSDSEET